MGWESPCALGPTAIEILRHPDKRLRRKAEVVDRFDAALAELCRALEATMLAGPGGVGIAAPQVGGNSRLIVVDCRHSQRPCRNHGRLRMANPRIVHSGGETLGREGCLSVPDWVGVVPRARSIRVEYMDERGEARSIEAEGFEARVIQHEIDHLDGILFIDRVVSTRGLIRRLSS